MKTYQRLMGILLVAMASAGLFAACGDNADTSCIADSDCAVGELCDSVTETCATECTTDAECAPGEICVDRAEQDGSICIADSGCTTDADCASGETCNTDTGTCEASSCTTDADCPNGTCNTDTGQCEAAGCTDNSDCASDQVCNSDTGMCETISTSYYFANIMDVSPTDSDALCISPSDEDPGSDLFGVSITRTDGNGDTVEYWANTMSADGVKATDEDGDTNANTDAFGIINGDAPGISGTCPDSFSDTTVVSLGCGGNILVEFVDADNNRIELMDGDTLNVYEYGGVCSSQTEQDEWQVELCTATENEVTGGNCGDGALTLGSGTGIGSVDVTLPGSAM